MEEHNYLQMNSSILYRCSQKYYDKRMSEFQIGAGQLLFLILIYENEGIGMQQLALKGGFDKGTVTKGIAKLEEQDYVEMRTSEEDKRAHCLFTTKKTKNIISDIYLLRREWWARVTQGLSQDEINEFERLQFKVTQNALQYMNEDDHGIKIFGIQKLTLLDWPGKLGSTIFTGGCNFRCPFCQNSDLVFLPENTGTIDTEEVIAFLKKRKNVLEGICISGGEPLLQVGLEDFLVEVKELGYQIKLDTNGTSPKRLKSLVDKGLIDYVAMDIKNSPKRYGETIGVIDFDLSSIKESIEYLLSGAIAYEFRTTIVKEFHTIEDMIEIANWIKGAKAYYLQNFVDSECVIQKNLHACDLDELKVMLSEVRKVIPTSELRGI
ncbi:MAG: anaerobic ribonucleoside-triphosphate reductase activating protein [Erysipelotrichaceae bacterium]